MTDGDYTKAEDWEELICENEGSFSKDEEYMIFDSNGIEIVINYEISVSGRVDYDPGDYYTPPYSDFDITYEDIFISSVTIDGYELELSKGIVFCQINKHAIMASLRDHKFVIKFPQIFVAAIQTQQPKSFTRAGFNHGRHQ